MGLTTFHPEINHLRRSVCHRISVSWANFELKVLFSCVNQIEVLSRVTCRLRKFGSTCPCSSRRIDYSVLFNHAPFQTGRGLCKHIGTLGFLPNPESLESDEWHIIRKSEWSVSWVAANIQSVLACIFWTSTLSRNFDLKSVLAVSTTWRRLHQPVWTWLNRGSLESCDGCNRTRSWGSNLS